MSLKGTLILADQVYKTVENKWVISGTYNHWCTSAEQLVMQTGLVLYIRLLTERIGTLNGRLTITNDADDPRVGNAMFSADIRLPITPDMIPVAEAKLVLNNFHVAGPPIADRPANSALILRSKIRLLVEDDHGEYQEIAYSPMIFSFYRPPDEVHDGHVAPNSSGGPGGDR